MSVDRINILNSPDGTIATIDKYQIALGMYPGTDNAGGGASTYGLKFHRKFGTLIKSKDSNSKKYITNYLNLKSFRDLA